MLKESEFTVKESTVVGHDMYGTTQITIDCTDEKDAIALAELLNNQFGIAVDYIGRTITGIPA